jgi:hypothetical protein
LTVLGEIAASARREREFTHRVVPAVKAEASYQLREFKCRAADYDDALQDSLAYAWLIYVRALEAGKDPMQWPSKVAVYAVQKAKRRRPCVGGKMTGSRAHLGDVYHHSRRASRISLGDLVEDVASRKAAVPDVVACKVDVGEWLDTLEPDEREAALLYAEGGCIRTVAEAMGRTRWWAETTRKALEASYEQFMA